MLHQMECRLLHEPTHVCLPYELLRLNNLVDVPRQTILTGLDADNQVNEPSPRLNPVTGTGSLTRTGMGTLTLINQNT
jgi:hypothetical protein